MIMTTVRELVEVGLDKKLTDFSLEQNFYTDLGLDSMGAIALFVELQRRTGIEVPEEEAPNIQTGQQLYELIASRTSHND